MEEMETGLFVLNKTSTWLHTTVPNISGLKITQTWVIVEVINLICLFISLYISVALLIHRCTGRKEIQQAQISVRENGDFSKRWSGTRNPPRESTSVSRSDYNGNASCHFENLEKMSIVGAIFTSLRISSEQLQLIFGTESDKLCNIFVKVQIVLYALPIAAIYGFLWARQRVMYQHPAMKLFSTKMTQIISWYVIFTMIIGELGTALIFISTRSYSRTEFGCALKETLVPGFIPWLIVVGTAVIFQGLLVGLFVYPLIRHRRTMKSIQHDSQITDTFKPVIKRVLVTTLVCVISDVIAALVTLATSTILISNVVYDANLLVNMMGICISFVDWRKRLIPCCKFQKNKQDFGNVYAVSHSQCSPQKRNFSHSPDVSQEV